MGRMKLPRRLHSGVTMRLSEFPPAAILDPHGYNA